MNPPVVTTIGHVDPNAAPLTINELIDLLNTVVISEIQGSYIPYIIQNGEPGVDDRDKAWIELDTAGRPIALKIFYSGSSGAWRRVYNGMLGEIRGFSGVPGFGDPPKLFDVNGRGNIGLAYDGWQICNGMNGSPNLTDKFLIGAHMDDSNSHTGYDNGWQTFVDGDSDLKTGGLPDKLITAEFLPPLDNRSADQQSSGTPEGLFLHGFEAKEDSPDHGAASALVDPHYANLHPHDVLIANYGSQPHGVVPVPQKNFPVLPPFYCLAWIIFKGY